MLTKMNDATAASAAVDLDAALSRILTTSRKSIAYDQGVRNGAACKKITLETDIAIYF